MGEAASLRFLLPSEVGSLALVDVFEGEAFDLTAAVDDSGIRKGL
jgi:hypothetical protein